MSEQSGCSPLNSSEKCNRESNSWEKQHVVLQRLVGTWVYGAHLLAWLGEEEEVIADITQEALCRTLERIRKADRQEAPPVNSLIALSKTIARNLFIDLVRKEKRLIPLSQLMHTFGDECFAFELADNAEDVVEGVFREALFNDVAPEIAELPKKQQWVLLVDLARHTNFIENESMLRRALSNKGVRLEDYMGWQAESSIERSRFSSLLSIAYKRIARSNCVKAYLKR